MSAPPKLLAARLRRLADFCDPPTETADHKPWPPELNLTNALRLAHDWASPLRSPHGPGTRGVITDPTGNARIDPSMTYHAHLIQAIDNVSEAVADLTNLVATITHRAEPQGRLSTITYCVACEEPALPRARSGRCPSCYRYWLDHDRTDRPKIDA